MRDLPAKTLAQILVKIKILVKILALEPLAKSSNAPNASKAIGAGQKRAVNLQLRFANWRPASLGAPTETPSMVA